MKEEKEEMQYEECIVCHKKTNVRKEIDICNREFYVEGAGQLCAECYFKLFNNRKVSGE